MEKTLESSTSSCEVKQTKGTQFRTSVLMGYMWTNYMWDSISSRAIKMACYKSLFGKYSRIPITASPLTCTSPSWKSFHIPRGLTVVHSDLASPAHLHSLSTSYASAPCRWPVRRLCTVILPRKASVGFVSWRLLFCLACVLSPTPVLVLRHWLLSWAPVLAPLVLSSLSTAAAVAAPQLLWVPLLWMVRLAGSEQGKPKTKATARLWHCFSGWKPLGWLSVACSTSLTSLTTFPGFIY